MSNRLRNRALSASMLAMLALAGCGGPQLDDAPPPPSNFVETPPPPPERPWRPDAPSGLLGGPPRERERPVYDDNTFGTMAPIPNPEDLDEDDRREIYGDKYEPATAREHTTPGHVRTLHRDHHAQRSLHARSASAQSARPSHLETHRTAAAPAAVTRPAPAATTAAKPSPAKPSAATTAPSAAAPANIDTVTEALGAAVANDVASGAKLDVPAGVFQGQEGVVVLTLPATLLSRLQAEASRLGLSDAARRIDALAILTAEGYDIVPTTEQSARMKDGEATSLSWKVTPKAGAKGAFQAHVSGELKNREKPAPFWIAVVETADPAAAKESDETAAQPTAFDLPGLPLITVPGVGQVRSGTIVLLGIGLVILILLAAAARNARERRRVKAREQRSRRLAEIAQSADTPGPQDVQPTAAAPGPDAADKDATDKKEPQGV